jgi:putative peptide zinc metalloprotease protein
MGAGMSQASQLVADALPRKLQTGADATRAPTGAGADAGLHQAAPASLPAGAGQPLPPLSLLREDLMLLPSSDHRDGSPTWVIQDPVRNKFIQIGWLEFELLSRWQPDALTVLREVVQETSLRPALADVLAFAQYLRQQGLTQMTSKPDLQAARAQPGKPGLANWRWWLHNYLFFRIPLARPDRFLQWIAPVTRWLFNPWLLGLLAGACALGVLLAARQWDVFVRSFVDSFTLSGLLSFAVALMLAKILHEMGHAVVATRLGVRVAHMGVAFLVLWPMLYTDTSESWRLRDHRQRLQIAAAGMLVELTLAGLALLVWALAPPGAVRSASFYLATTSIIMTLALNLSPFMRFDGYYVLSDILDMPNLHERSGALAKTWLRRTLLGWQDAWPEMFPRKVQITMIVFALCTWVYRLFLFLGIAVAVYVMFFKALGIFLFAVEIIWFVIRPFQAEFTVWFRRRRDIQTGRASVWLLLFLLPLVLLAVPWQHDIHAPAHLRAEYRSIYSPLAGRVLSVQKPGLVAAGQPLVVLDSPRLRSEAARAKINTQSTQAALTSIELAQDGKREDIGKLGETVQQYAAEGRAASQELARLRLISEFAGQWMDVDNTVVPGSWVRPQDMLGTLVDDSRWLVEAWVEESLVQRLVVGAKGKFYPGNVMEAPIEVTLVQIDPLRATSVPQPGLSVDHGGAILTQTEGRTLVPREALYRVQLQVQTKPDITRWTRGRVVLQGEQYSLLLRGLRYASSILIRESGF